MKQLEPLYELLATIVHMEYADSEHAIKELIPSQITAAISLFEISPIEPEQKEEMKEGVMWYMYEDREFFKDFNQHADYRDHIHLSNIIHRFQLDAERTRIYLELWERDKEAKIDYLALDF